MNSHHRKNEVGLEHISGQRPWEGGRRDHREAVRLLNVLIIPDTLARLARELAALAGNPASLKPHGLGCGSTVEHLYMLSMKSLILFRGFVRPPTLKKLEWEHIPRRQDGEFKVIPSYVVNSKVACAT